MRLCKEAFYKKKDNFYSKLSIILTTLSSAVLNICEYVFNVSSIFVCPKNLATNVTLAPLLIKRDAHEYTQINNIFQSKGDYVLIDDYTTDVDNEWDIERIEAHVQ